jgi:hypothetical protein
MQDGNNTRMRASKEFITRISEQHQRIPSAFQIWDIKQQVIVVKEINRRTEDIKHKNIKVK